MSITVVTRPEKTLSNGFLSTWNSSELPLRCKFENDLFPINKVDLIESIQSVNYAPDKQGTAITFSFSPGIIWSVNYRFYFVSGLSIWDDIGLKYHFSLDLDQIDLIEDKEIIIEREDVLVGTLGYNDSIIIEHPYRTVKPTEEHPYERSV